VQPFTAVRVGLETALVVPVLRIEHEDRRPVADRPVVAQPLALRNDLPAVHPDPETVRPTGLGGDVVVEVHTAIRCA
jgi:hypothetical protein